MTPPTLAQRCGAEAIGTFALVFVGCGAIVVDSRFQVLGHGGVAAAFGLVIAVMIYAVGHVSGAHFNPAVTLAFASLKKTSWRDVGAYVLAQLTAAALAAFVLRVMLGTTGELGVTVPTAGVGVAFAFEFVLTFILMFVITSVATDNRAAGSQAGVAIGGTVAMAALVGGPLSGASMNPARSLGPALLAAHFDGIWLYLSAPVLGAVAAAQTYRWLAR